MSERPHIHVHSYSFQSPINFAEHSGFSMQATTVWFFNGHGIFCLSETEINTWFLIIPGCDPWVLMELTHYWNSANLFKTMINVITFIHRYGSRQIGQLGPVAQMSGAHLSRAQFSKNHRYCLSCFPMLWSIGVSNLKNFLANLQIQYHSYWQCSSNETLKRAQTWSLKQAEERPKQLFKDKMYITQAQSVGKILTLQCIGILWHWDTRAWHVTIWCNSMSSFFSICPFEVVK